MPLQVRPENLSPPRHHLKVLLPLWPLLTPRLHPNHLQPLSVHPSILLVHPPRHPLHIPRIVRLPPLLHRLPLHRSRLPDPLLVADDELACLALHPQKHAVLPHATQFSQRAADPLLPPQHCLAELDPAAPRRLALAPLICRLPVMAHLEAVQEVGRILHQPWDDCTRRRHLHLPPLLQRNLQHPHLALYTLNRPLHHSIAGMRSHRRRFNDPPAPQHRLLLAHLVHQAHDGRLLVRLRDDVQLLDADLL